MGSCRNGRELVPRSHVAWGLAFVHGGLVCRKVELLAGKRDHTGAGGVLSMFMSAFAGLEMGEGCGVKQTCMGSC